MKTSTRVVLLATSLLMIFESCTVQDHLQPVETSNCLISKIITKNGIEANPDIKVGTEISGRKVVELVEVNGKTYYLLEGGSFYAPTDGSVEYLYDSQGRIIQSLAPSYNPQLVYIGDFKDVYSYNSGKIIVESSNPNSTGVSSYTLPLNDAGYIKEGGAGTGVLADAYYYKDMVYNSDGYLIEATFAPYFPDVYSGIKKYSIESGNLVKTEAIQINTELNTTDVYEYDLTKPALPNPFPFNGKQSKNLLIKATRFDNSGNAKVIYEYQYRYENNKVRQIQIPVKGSSYGPVISDFFLECK